MWTEVLITSKLRFLWFFGVWVLFCFVFFTFISNTWINKDPSIIGWSTSSSARGFNPWALFPGIFHLKLPQHLLILLNVLFRTSVWGAWGINTKNLRLLSHLQIDLKELTPLFCPALSLPDRTPLSILRCFQLHIGSISPASIAGYKWKPTGNNLTCAFEDFHSG